MLENRGVLDFDQLHISRRTRDLLKKPPYRVTFDQAFEQVIRGCANMPRQEEGGTWISEKFIRTYLELHHMGYAHSAEAWDGDRLVGGVYGVLVQGVFSGESMFHTADNGSKIALIALIERLKAKGHTWMDTQQVSALPKQLGAKEIPRSEYAAKLRQAQQNPKGF